MLQIFSLLFLKLIIDEEGQGLAEYALILGLIFMAVVIALGLLGESVANFYERFAEEMPVPD